jgi:aminoglycoside phosphotransferase (APT) family kinase protein
MSPTTGITVSHLAAVARVHGLPVPLALPTPWTGATSHVYPCGDAVIKVAHDREDAATAVVADARMSKVARTLGVAAPRLLALDESRELVPVPYAVFERVTDAIPLGQWTGAPETAAAGWRDVGRELARVHQVAVGTSMPLDLRTFRQSPNVDPRPWAGQLRERGALDPVDAAWLHDLLNRLAPAALADVPPTLCHGDVNAANVLVDADSGAFCALIDWAGAGWLDPAWDFAGVSLEAVPPLLEGHRGVGPLPNDGTAEARVLWCQVQTRLHAALANPDAATVRSRLARDLAHIRDYVAREHLAH